ncbi:S-layer homology domain-containing protein [Paenibacillus glycinis]|uniref:SLH domain-containing protein n=1 Tax=Paenibacillus glycinis TaxID=2697035 RepID=A0ABW9XLQ1_9BACL|nr:hypothetical protein [Paenibacillus glycinis]
MFAVEQAPTVSFSDIAGHWAETDIQKEIKSGIINGYADGTFKPDAMVTRAEFAVMLTSASKPQGDGASLSFTDEAKIAAWARGAVAQAVQAGFITGDKDGTFRPNDPITRAEMQSSLRKPRASLSQAILKPALRTTTILRLGRKGASSMCSRQA